MFAAASSPLWSMWMVGEEGWGGQLGSVSGTVCLQSSRQTWHQVSWQMCCSWDALGAKDPSQVLAAALPGVVEVVSKGREAQWVLVMGAKKGFTHKYSHIALRSLTKGWMSGRWDTFVMSALPAWHRSEYRTCRHLLFLHHIFKKNKLKTNCWPEKGKIVKCCFPSAVGCLGSVPWQGWACVR